MSLSIADRKAKIEYLKGIIEDSKKQLQEARDISDSGEILYKVGDIIVPKDIDGVRCYSFSDRKFIIDKIIIDDFYGVNYLCTVLKSNGDRSKRSGSFSFFN